MRHLLLLLILAINATWSFRLQGAAVKGTLICNGKPWRNAKVKLYDLDRNPGDADDLLSERFSDRDGEFVVDGTTREMTDIEPVVYIYHDCEDGIRPCQKKLTYVVPKSYIHHGKASKFYDLGKINLDVKEVNPERSCEH